LESVAPQIKRIVGIDTGSNTGVAVYEIGTGFVDIQTLKIHNALFHANQYNRVETFFIVEDARMRKYFGKDFNIVKLQGAGSIKRDSTIWDDFLSDTLSQYSLVSPAVLAPYTKLHNTTVFRNLTKWEGKTSIHARDAAYLVLYGLNNWNKL